MGTFIIEADGLGREFTGGQAHYNVVMSMVDLLEKPTAQRFRDLIVAMTEYENWWFSVPEHEEFKTGGDV